MITTPNQLTNKYEIHFLKNKKNKNYLYINHGAPNEGMGKWIWNHGPKYFGKLLYHTRGEKGSLAQKVVTFVEKNIDQYPHLQTYHFFPGPNSNSFTQWILNAFPEINISLPTNAFGKEYPIVSSS